jgi:DNA-binding MarR family transcriptional regulator
MQESHSAGPGHDLGDAIFEAITAWFRANDRLHASGEVARRSGVELARWLHPVVHVIGERQPVRVKDIALELAIPPSTATRHVDQLVSRGLAERRQDPDDGRASLVNLTGAGARTRDALRRAFSEAFADALNSWPEPRRDRVAVDLMEFAQGLRALASVSDRSTLGRSV